MKRFLFKKILIATGVMVWATGCDNFLEENPDNRVELNTPEKAAQLLTSAYSSAAYTFTEWMSDNVSYTTGTVILPEHDQAYRWEDVVNDNQDTPTYFWNATYDAIAHANEVLAVIDDLPGERSRKNAVKGEAYLTRAYGHFMLVNLFAKHYNPQTSSDDPGIPYVDEPEKQFIKTYERQSVKKVYDEIERDLLRGLDRVDGSYYAHSGKYHFTLGAALALASRFYLFKGDWNKCIEYSSRLLGDSPGAILKDINVLLKETVNPEDFIRAYTSPTDPSNLLMIRHITNFPVNVGYWPHPNLLRSLYNNNPWDAIDIRTSNEYPIFIRGNGLTIAKYEFLFERSSLTSNVGLYYTIMPVFRTEEVLLNRAEAYVMVNNLNAAVRDLQELVNKRYDGNRTVTLPLLRAYFNTNNSQLATLLFIIEERRKEFMHEGLRWFDIKRFSLPVIHNLAGGTLIRLESDDLRKVLQIPQAAQSVGKLEPNPR